MMFLYYFIIIIQRTAALVCSVLIFLLRFQFIEPNKPFRFCCKAFSPRQHQTIPNSRLSVNNVMLSFEMVWNRMIIVNRDPTYLYLLIPQPSAPLSPAPKMTHKDGSRRVQMFSSASKSYYSHYSVIGTRWPYYPCKCTHTVLV